VLITESGHLKVQLSLEALNLFKQPSDESLTITFQCGGDDVLEVINPVLSELGLRKRRNCLFQLLEKIEEGIGK
jgi:hypothetical protein